MGRELISVIVPVYNAEQYLRACLNSLRQQRYSALEVWMVDDGSTDGSGAICDEYEAADCRFHAVHQHNAGVSAARNAGIRMAGGKYIGFIDSDDWVEPEFYETLAGMLNGETAMSMCCYCLGDGKPCLPMGKTEAAEYRAEDALVFIVADKMSGPCNKLFLRERIRERGLAFDPKITVGEDMLFVYQYIAGGSMRFVPSPLYHYRQTEDSSSRSDFRLSRMTLFDAMDKMEAEVPEGYESVRKAIRSKRVYAGYVSLLMLKTSREKPRNEKETERKLIQIIRGNLGEFLKAPGYTAVEKAAAVLIAASPEAGSRIYSATYMKKIKNR